MNDYDDHKAGTIQHKPFTKTKLGESEDVVSVKLNREERDILDNFKEYIDQSKDATAFKICLFYASKVIPNEFGSMLGVRLFKKRTPKYKFFPSKGN